MNLKKRVDSFNSLTQEILNQEKIISSIAKEMVKRSDNLIVCTGVGKSFIMAERLAASLRSIGMRAFHIDGNHFSHGDFGVLVKGTYQLVAISNSGETKEILDLLHNCDRDNGLIVSITGNKNSTLAELSNFSISNHVGRSLDYLGFLPTYSLTEVSMIIDLLVMQICDELELTANQFLVNHYSGHLGSLLSSKIDNLIIPYSECAIVDAETELLTVVDMMNKKGNGLAVVLSESLSLIGVISDGDVRRAFANTSLKSTGRAQDLLSFSPVTIEAGSTIALALNLMNRNTKKKISVLPVITEDRFVGLLTLKKLTEKLVS
jgi:arabinose-5-phosphate isomerase